MQGRCLPFQVPHSARWPFRPALDAYDVIQVPGQPDAVFLGGTQDGENFGHDGFAITLRGCIRRTRIWLWRLFEDEKRVEAGASPR